MNIKIKIIRSLSFTLFFFGLLGWLYIVLNSVAHMDTLSMPLTHFLSFPREDTAGIISFFVSMVSFFVWNMVKKDE